MHVCTYTYAHTQTADMYGNIAGAIFVFTNRGYALVVADMLSYLCGHLLFQDKLLLARVCVRGGQLHTGSRGLRCRGDWRILCYCKGVFGVTSLLAKRSVVAGMIAVLLFCSKVMRGQCQSAIAVLLSFLSEI